MKARSAILCSIGLYALVSANVLVAQSRGKPVPAADSASSEVGDFQMLAKRWAQLYAYLIEQYRVDGRSAIANVEGDFSTREMRIRIVPEDEAAWVSRTLSEKELRTADIKRIAADLYSAAKKRAGVR